MNRKANASAIPPLRDGTDWFLDAKAKADAKALQDKVVELEDKVEEALEKPKPGTGTYTIDMGDPAASNSWPPTRMEFNMKDQMARNQIDALVKEIDEMKEEIKELRK